MQTTYIECIIETYITCCLLLIISVYVLSSVLCGKKVAQLKVFFALKKWAHFYMMSHASGSTRQNNHKKHVTTSRSVKFLSSYSKLNRLCIAHKAGVSRHSTIHTILQHSVYLARLQSCVIEHFSQ